MLTGKLKTNRVEALEGLFAGLAASVEHEGVNTCDSNCKSCPIKLKFGEMTLLRCLTNSKASSNFTRLALMR